MVQARTKDTVRPLYEGPLRRREEVGEVGLTGEVGERSHNEEDTLVYVPATVQPPLPIRQRGCEECEGTRRETWEGCSTERSEVDVECSSQVFLESTSSLR